MAVTHEIFEELLRIDGGLGEFLKTCKPVMLHEIGKGDWDWQTYLNHMVRMQETYREWISEYTGGSSKTVCLNDLTIVALAKTLNLPVISMESKIIDANAKKRRIPNICDMERVQHYTFNDFLRLEQYRD